MVGMCQGGFIGQSLQIRKGKNFIGRAERMDIRVLGDPDIAPDNHAVIAYDDKAKKFTLLPGKGNGMVYHENEAVYLPSTISSYDKIEMGSSMFLLVGLVGKRLHGKRDC